MAKLKICFVAPPSCDKTTTAREVVKILKKTHGINAEVAEEYARKYIRDNYDGTHPIIDPHQQYPIILGQMETERMVSKLHDVVVCDSASFLGYIYVKEMITNLPKQQSIKPMYFKLLKDIHEMSLREISSYDAVFLFEPTGSIFQDGIRSQKDDDQIPIYNKIKGFLDSEGIPYYKISGKAEEKANEVVNTLKPTLEQIGLLEVRHAN